MPIRLAKIALAAGVGLYLALVVFNNLTDYGSNYQFVHHVLAMDTTFPGNAGMWRAIDAPWIYHAFFASIILWEAIACGCTFAGAWRLWTLRASSAAAFNLGKRIAIAGLAINTANLPGTACLREIATTTTSTASSRDLRRSTGACQFFGGGRLVDCRYMRGRSNSASAKFLPPATSAILASRIGRPAPLPCDRARAVGW